MEKLVGKTFVVVAIADVVVVVVVVVAFVDVISSASDVVGAFVLVAVPVCNKSCC